MVNDGYSNIYIYWLVVFRHPSEKWWSQFVSWDYYSIPNSNVKIKKIPNHQSDQLQLILRVFPTYQSWDLKV